MGSREDKTPDKARAQVDSAPASKPPATWIEQLAALKPAAMEWAEERGKALNRERAQTHRECVRLESQGGPALSRLIRCLDVLLQRPSVWLEVQFQGFFRELADYALWLAEETRREHSRNEALRVALFRVDAELQPAWSLTRNLKSRLREIRAELFTFVPTVGVRDEATVHPTSATGGLLSCADLAARYNVPPDALRKRLSRWRGKNLDGGWREVADLKSRAPRYLYDPAAVASVLNALKRG